MRMDRKFVENATLTVVCGTLLIGPGALVLAGAAATGYLSWMTAKGGCRRATRICNQAMTYLKQRKEEREALTLYSPESQERPPTLQEEVMWIREEYEEKLRALKQLPLDETEMGVVGEVLKERLIEEVDGLL